MNQTLQFTASLGAGLALGLLNRLFWKQWGKSLTARQKVVGPLFLVKSLFKMGLLGLILWVLLTKHWVDPLWFLAGFTVTVFFTIFKGFKWH